MTTSFAPRHQFQIGNELPTVAVLGAIETLEDADFTELPPLYESIDPEALDTVFQNLDHGEVTFTYHGYTITIQDSGTFYVEAL